MSNSDDISLDEVRRTIKHLAATSGRSRVSAFAVANHLGVSNTTFRRRFPMIVEELRISDGRQGAVSALVKANRDIVRLREENTALRENLELAAASVQRLSDICNRLLREVESSGRVKAISEARSARGRSS